MGKQFQLLQLLKAPTSPALDAGSVLDSGSSKHLHSEVQVAHSDIFTSGFSIYFSIDAKPAWTQGNGYLPLAERDAVTGQPSSYDVWCSGKLNTTPPDIMSLGKLVRSNYPFYFESAGSPVAVTADKQSRFKVDLGHDGILCLLHDLCSGRQSAPVPEEFRHKVTLLLEGGTRAE